MRRNRLMRVGVMIAMGATLFQASSCNPSNFNEFVQTVLLGITAAGAIVIIENV